MGFYERLADNSFIEEDGAYYVRPHGRYIGSKRQFESETEYEEARSYFIKTQKWFIPVATVSGMATVKFGLIGLVALVTVLTIYYARVLPRITQNTVPVS